MCKTLSSVFSITNKQASISKLGVEIKQIIHTHTQNIYIYIVERKTEKRMRNKMVQIEHTNNATDLRSLVILNVNDLGTQI
jgi:CRISPR/Cas system-associated endoribonuclease Cas2